MNSSNTIQEITMESLTYHLNVSYYTRNPVFLHGPPGVGKSSGIYAFCEQKFNEGEFKSAEPVDIRLGNHDITDFKFPLVDREREVLKWIVADIFPREDRDGPNGVLFLDELSSAPLQIQTMAYAILQERKIPSTGYKLPPGWIAVAAGNRETDQAVVHKLSSALCNRVNHFDIRPDWLSFKNWAEKHSVSSFIIQFLEGRHSDYLYKYTRGQKAYPTPRTWEKASDALGVLLREKAPLFRIREQMVSWLGEEAGTAISAFVDVCNTLPKATDLLEGKTKMPNISEIDKLFILGQTLSSAVQTNPSKYAAPYLTILLKDLNEEIAVDSLRRTLSNEATKNKVVAAFQKESTLFNKAVKKYGSALSKLGLEK